MTLDTAEVDLSTEPSPFSFYDFSSTISFFLNKWNCRLLELWCIDVLSNYQMCTLFTFDLWLNFDSSIWTMTPGPPSLGIGCKIIACQATSLHFRAIFMRILRDAIPSKNIAVKESLWVHFQRNWTCRCSESLLPSKKDPVLTDFISPHRLHFLVNPIILVVINQTHHHY